MAHNFLRAKAKFVNQGIVLDEEMFLAKFRIHANFPCWDIF